MILLCSALNFNLSGTNGQLLKVDTFDMYSGGKRGHFAASWFPARAHAGTAGWWLFRLLLCGVFNDKVYWTLTKIASLGSESSAVPEAGVLVMHLHPKLVSHYSYMHVIA